MAHSIYHFGSRAQAIAMADLLPRVFSVGGKECFNVNHRIASGASAKTQRPCYELTYTPREIPAKGQPQIIGLLAEHYAAQMQGYVRGYLYALAQEKRMGKAVASFLGG